MAVLNGIKFKDSEEVHKLDYNKALENLPTLVKSFNDLEDKPFYSESREVDILAKADYEFAQSDSGNIYVCLSETNSTPNDGETCKVMWDNTEYECVATLVDGMYALGNLGMLGLETTTDEPFLIGIGDYDGSIAVMIYTTDTATSHNIRIYQNEEVVHQIPSKYVDSYTKTQIDEMFGAYVDEVNTLLGGED